jgi:hypothetical protein
MSPLTVVMYGVSPMPTPLLDSDQAKYLIASYPLSVWHPRN